MVEKLQPAYLIIPKDRTGGEVKDSSALPTLSPRGKEIFELSGRYQESHQGTLPRQSWIAYQLKTSNTNVNRLKHDMLDKGYEIPFITNMETIEEERGKLREEVKPYWQDGLSLGQIAKKIHKKKNVVLGAVMRLQREEQVAKRRVIRSPEESVKFEEDVKVLSGTVLTNAEIARFLHVPVSAVMGANVRLIARNEMKPRPRRWSMHLSEQNQDIVAYRALGLQNKDIAEMLDKSEYSIEHIIMRLIEKKILERKRSAVKSAEGKQEITSPP